MPKIVAEAARSSIPMIVAGVAWITPDIIGEGACKNFESVVEPDGD